MCDWIHMTKNEPSTGQEPVWAAHGHMLMQAYRSVEHMYCPGPPRSTLALLPALHHPIFMQLCLCRNMSLAHARQLLLEKKQQPLVPQTAPPTAVMELWPAPPVQGARSWLLHWLSFILQAQWREEKMRKLRKRQNLPLHLLRALQSVRLRAWQLTKAKTSLQGWQSDE